MVSLVLNLFRESCSEMIESTPDTQIQSSCFNRMVSLISSSLLLLFISTLSAGSPRNTAIVHNTPPSSPISSARLSYEPLSSPSNSAILLDSPPRYEFVMNGPIANEVDFSKYGISLFQLRIAAAEHFVRVKNNPERFSLGYVLDEVLASVVKNKTSTETRQNYEHLLSKTQFFQTLIVESDAVQEMNKPHLNYNEACRLFELLSKASFSSQDLDAYRNVLKAKLPDPRQGEDLNVFFAESLQVSRQSLRTQSFKMSIDFLDQSSLSMTDRDKLDLLLKSVRRADSITANELELLLQRLPKTQVKPSSEKDLLQLRNLIRKYTGNVKWTAWDLYYMDVSLNFTLIYEALAIAERAETQEQSQRIQRLVQSVLTFSTIHDIDVNPSKPHMKVPAKRNIFKFYIVNGFLDQFIK